jgi:hypothetical protein
MGGLTLRKRADGGDVTPEAVGTSSFEPRREDELGVNVADRRTQSPDEVGVWPPHDGRRRKAQHAEDRLTGCRERFGINACAFARAADRVQSCQD